MTLETYAAYATICLVATIVPACSLSLVARRAIGRIGGGVPILGGAWLASARRRLSTEAEVAAPHEIDHDRS